MEVTPYRRTAIPEAHMHMTPTVHRCPRCGFRGDGVPYFRRPSHVALLAGVGLFTYGIGGLVYWMVKRNHLVCANCGLGWEHSGSPRGAFAAGGESPFSSRSEPEPPLPAGGLGRRLFGGALGLLSVLLLTIGIVEVEAPLMVVGAVMGMAGSGTFLWGWRALQARRQALLTAMQRKVLLLAGRRGGALTVTEVAAELSLSINAAERILIAMEDGLRVRSEVTDEGIVLYEFPELQRPRAVGPRPSPHGDPLLPPPPPGA